MKNCSLNPCCSGRWSRTLVPVSVTDDNGGLNPCCSGRWSRTTSRGEDQWLRSLVLILVVVEDGLVPRKFSPKLEKEVLILVVVEDGLVLDLIRLC